MTVHALPRTESAGSGPMLEIQMTEFLEPSAENFGALFHDVQALVECSAMWAMQDRLPDIDPGQMVNRAKGAVFGVYVDRLKYESPLEIVLTVGTIGVIGTSVLQRVVNLFNAVQGARKEKSDADLHVARNQYEMRQISAAMDILQSNIQNAGRPEVISTTEGAARALTNMQSAEFSPGTSAG